MSHTAVTKKIKGQSVFYRLSTVFAVKWKFGF